MIRPTRRSLASAGFTLVEMLVVIGIIAVLAALLLPAVMGAITSARNTVIALEVKQLDTAIEAYRLEKGDYPPNFRNPDVVRRHITKCYPRIDPTYFSDFMKYAFPTDGVTIPAPTKPMIDESESLVFWLSMTDTNAQYPFLSLNFKRSVTSTLPAANPKKYYDFDQTRLSQAISLDIPSFKAKFCGDTFYIYIDSRSYDNPLTDATDLCRFQTPDGVNTFGFADDSVNGVRPYWSDATSSNAKSVPSGSSTLIRDKYKPINPNKFQIICAGQDGDFGYSSSDVDVKSFPSGANANQSYNLGDNDNITNFSNGRTLKNSMP